MSTLCLVFPSSYWCCMENFNITIKNLVLFYFVTTKQGDIGLGFNFKKNKERKNCSRCKQQRTLNQNIFLNRSIRSLFWRDVSGKKKEEKLILTGEVEEDWAHEFFGREMMNLPGQKTITKYSFNDFLWQIIEVINHYIVVWESYLESLLLFFFSIFFVCVFVGESRNVVRSLQLVFFCQIEIHPQFLIVPTKIKHSLNLSKYKFLRFN
jgi:hypothetical protein